MLVDAVMRVGNVGLETSIADIASWNDAGYYKRKKHCLLG